MSTGDNPIDLRLPRRERTDRNVRGGQSVRDMLVYVDESDWTIQVYITVQSFDRRESRDLSDSRFAIRKLILRLLFQLNKKYQVIPGILDIVAYYTISIPNHLSILW